MRDVITLGPAPAGEPWARIDPVRLHGTRSRPLLGLHASASASIRKRAPGAELQETAVSIPGGSCLMVVCYFGN